MSSTQFSMVEELASLVNYNLPSKHLILSVEEALVNFLRDGISLDGVLELEPMNPYNRLLVHRLADIFGFSHQSVGEGEARHLVLQRCTETSVPPILVSDFLQFDEMQPPMIFEEPRWKEIMPGQRNIAVSKSSFEETETSYFAARERIFSADASNTELVKERPKHDPVVARRMIAHALGQSDKVMKHELTSNELGTNSLSDEHQGPRTTSHDITQTKDCLRKEHMGAAKRLFANALGMHRRGYQPSKCDETKKTSC